MKTQPKRAFRNINGGFSLMEVLIAMLILAVGLLGLAAMQARALKFGHDAYGRSQATMIAYDIMDKMRANVANVASYTGAASGAACDPTVTGVAMELRCWLDGLAAVLPAGTGNIVQNAFDATMYDVTIQWSDRETQTAADCAARNRTWDGALTTCMVNQVWIIWP